MVKIVLNRSGGLLGRTMEAITETDIDETVLIKALEKGLKKRNLAERDELRYMVTINGTQTFQIEIDNLSGEIKQVLLQLENNLKLKQ